MRPRDRSRLVCALVCVALGVSGCAQPLFSPKKQRSQYDRYDRSRNQYAPQVVEDEFGREEPNLWGRLEPKG